MSLAAGDKVQRHEESGVVVGPSTFDEDYEDPKQPGVRRRREIPSLAIEWNGAGEHHRTHHRLEGLDAELKKLGITKA